MSATPVPAPAGKFFTSMDMGDILEGKTTEITPGVNYDIDGYGLMFGHHNRCDQGRFVYTRIKGDFDISVQMESVRNDKNAFAEAGLMVRKDLTPNGLMLGQSVANNEYHSEGDQYIFMYRLKENGCSDDNPVSEIFGKGTYGNKNYAHSGWGYYPDDVGKRPRPFPKVWLRIKREGNRYVGFFRENDLPWTKLGETRIKLGKEPYVGMFITANHHGGNANIRAQAKFRNLQGFWK